MKLLRFPGAQSVRPMPIDPDQNLRARFEIFFRAVGQREAHLAGSFNQWNPSALPMIQEPDGAWGATLDLGPGCHEFKIISQGRWVEEGNCFVVVERESRKLILKPDQVLNPFGTWNFIIWVK